MQNTDPYASTAERDPYAATAEGAHYNVPASEAPALRKRLMGEAASRDKAAVDQTMQTAATPPAAATGAEAPTPGFFKRTWGAINTPIGSHFDTYNRETEQLNRAQNFAETEEGRQAYAKHPILTGAKSFVAGFERDASDMLTPAFAATSVLPATNAFVKAAVPSVAQVLSTAGKYANAMAIGSFTGVGLEEAFNAIRDDKMKSEDRARAILGGGSAFSGVAAMTANALPRPTPGVLRRTAQAVIVGRRAVPNMIRDTIKNNAAEVERVAAVNATNEQAHTTNTRKVEQANLDTAAEYRRNLARLKTADSATLDQYHKTVAQHKADVAAAQAAHDEAVAAITEKNQQAAKEHEGGVVQALQQRKGAEQVAGLREQAEANLQQATDAYFAKEDATDLRVKADTNKTWEPWHAKAKSAMVDVDPLVDVLERVGADNPEAVKLMRKMAPPEDFVPPESQFVKDRQGIIDEQNYTGGPGMPYDRLNPLQKQQIDAKVQAAGFEPEPVDFTPVRGAPMSLEDIHRAQSILGENIASGKYEGVVKGEMIQIHKALKAAEYRGSKEVGALPELQAGQKATREYKEAFGKERRLQRTGKTERKADANADAVDEREEQARLAAVAKHDTSLVEDYKAVQAAREHLKSLPDPEQLRKGLGAAEPPDRPIEKPLPQPPEVKPEPEVPLLHGRQGVPELKPLPVPPPSEEARIVRPGLDEIRQAKLGGLNDQIEWIHHRGKWVASGAAFSGVLYGVLNGKISKVGEAIAAGGASLVLTNKFANFLERPGVQEWLTRPEPSDLQYFQKLPPEQRAAVAEGLRPAVDEARSKGLKVSPALLTLVGAQLSQPKTAGEAKQQAAATQRDPYMVEKNPKGLVAPGNLPIWSRPTVKNADGSHSTEYSTSFQDDDGSEVLVPTVVNGRFLTPDGKKPPEKSAAEKAMFKAAWQHYKKTGQNLGKFKTPDDADTYAGKLHNR